MTTIDPALARMAQIARETQTAGRSRRIYSERINERVGELRDLADKVEACNPEDPIIDESIKEEVEGGGIYIFAAWFLFTEDADVMYAVEHLHKELTTAEALTYVIKPYLKKALLAVEEETLKQYVPIPAWERPIWLSKDWPMTDKLEKLRRSLGK